MGQQTDGAKSIKLLKCGIFGKIYVEILKTGWLQFIFADVVLNLSE